MGIVEWIGMDRGHSSATLKKDVVGVRKLLNG